MAFRNDFSANLHPNRFARGQVGHQAVSRSTGIVCSDEDSGKIRMNLMVFVDMRISISLSQYDGQTIGANLAVELAHLHCAFPGQASVCRNPAVTKNRF
jgi:hypothetical protein